jgi:hypothetical protein
MAFYPETLTTFTHRLDLVDVVRALDVNRVYDELGAISADLGAGTMSANGLKATVLSTASGATMNTTATTFSGLSARLGNIEVGAYHGYLNRISTRGGSTLTSSAVGVIGLIVKALPNQTSNFFEFRDKDDNVLAKVTSSGSFVSSKISGGTP